MNYRAAFPIIYCADVSRSVAFYRDGLGFTETFRYPADTDEAAFVALTLDDGTSVGLGGPGDSDHGLPIRPGARGFEMCIYADDVDAAVGELRSRGDAVLLEPVDQPWGERMAYVADPDGNPVMICAPLSEAGTADQPGR